MPSGMEGSVSRHTMGPAAWGFMMDCAQLQQACVHVGRQALLRPRCQHRTCAGPRRGMPPRWWTSRAISGICKWYKPTNPRGGLVLRRADGACPDELCIGNLGPLELNHTDNTRRLNFSHVYVPYACRYRLYDNLGCLRGRRTLFLGHSRTQQLAQYTGWSANKTNAREAIGDSSSGKRDSRNSSRTGEESLRPYTVVHEVRMGARLGLPYILEQHNVTHAMEAYDFVVYCRCVLVVWRYSTHRRPLGIPYGMEGTVAKHSFRRTGTGGHGWLHLCAFAIL